MQIIIPMSGVGRRFIERGYKLPKPLIEVDGKSIIEHVVSLFPGEENFVFICNEKHLRETEMRNILMKAAPKGKIVGIPPHKKGPVYAVSKIFDLIDDDDEVVVNYCDFFTYWDYADFLKFVRGRQADGAVPAYRGFHPHMRGTTNYAFMRDDDQWMLEIREKAPFTENRMAEFASNGTYYFRTGQLLKDSFRALLNSDQTVGGEYYVSLVYNYLVQAGRKVAIYEIQHMFQWGTPDDLEEYQGWSGFFRQMVEPRPANGRPLLDVALVPLAGRGARFSAEGYKEPKPLIEVGGKPMVVQAALSLPPSWEQRFVCLGDHLDSFPLNTVLKTEFPDSKVCRTNGVTEGQACTVELGLAGIDDEHSLIVGACDNGMLYDVERFASLTQTPGIDAIVFSFRHHVSSRKNPHMYGWLKVDPEDRVTGVSVKKPISENPFEDHAIVGTFYFRKVALFRKALKILYERDIRVNGEFYVDSLIAVMIDLGLTVKVFEVDFYVCWGTPDDLRTYEYWQSCFHKWDAHPYSLEQDPSVDPNKVTELEQRFLDFKQKSR